MSEKKPRLFYFEEAENAWCVCPDKFCQIFDITDMEPDFIIEFKIAHLTDEEFDNLPED